MQTGDNVNNLNKGDTTIVGLRQLRENVGSYISEVEAGKSFTVVKRSRAIFKITPIHKDADSDRRESISDLTQLKRGGIDIDDLLTRI